MLQRRVSRGALPFAAPQDELVGTVWRGQSQVDRRHPGDEREQQRRKNWCVLRGAFLPNTVRSTLQTQLRIGSAGQYLFQPRIIFDREQLSNPEPFELYKKDGKFYLLVDFGDPGNCNVIRLRQK